MSYLQAVHTGEHLIRLEPPRATQGELKVALSNRLEMIQVDDDVYGVITHLRGIDPGFNMLYDLKAEVYVLFWEGMREKDGEWQHCEDLVGAYKELDSRLITLVEKIDKQNRSRYDFVAELDRLDREADKRRDDAFSEQIGEAGERLAHALRKDLGATNRAFMSGAPRGRKKAKRRRGR